MIKSIYTKIIEISKKKYALPILLAVAFFESFIFPIPPDIFLIFLVLAQRNKAFHLAFYCTLLSVVGGILGYLIGSYFFDSIGQGILNYYDLNNKFVAFSEGYSEHGFLIVAAGGFTPIPYKLITIFSGFVKMDFFEFTFASIISRGARFFLVASLLFFFGKKIEELLIKRFGLITALLFLIIIVVYFLIRYLN
tara:strand:- start:597 stop:1178 length:582 start_codon:yes stop_codon:yes gene_type:complete